MKTKMTILDLIYNRVTNCIFGLFKIVSICFCFFFSPMFTNKLYSMQHWKS